MLKGKTLLAYVAGIIDADGYISLIKIQQHSYRVSLRVGVNSTNMWLIHFLQAQFGGFLHAHQRKKKNWKESLAWALSGNHAIEFLKLILPYLQLKKHQAEIAIKFQERRHPYIHSTESEKILDEADYIAMRKWNQRGVKEIGRT